MRIVWQTVRRITNEILGVKGLGYVYFLIVSLSLIKLCELLLKPPFWSLREVLPISQDSFLPKPLVLQLVSLVLPQNLFHIESLNCTIITCRSVSQRNEKLPVDIPDFRGVVHGTRSQKITTRVPGTAPHRMGVVSEGQHTFCFGKIPDLNCPITGWSG